MLKRNVERKIQLYFRKNKHLLEWKHRSYVDKMVQFTHEGQVPIHNITRVVLRLEKIGRYLYKTE
jgi:hypothetical protein